MIDMVKLAEGLCGMARGYQTAPRRTKPVDDGPSIDALVEQPGPDIDDLVSQVEPKRERAKAGAL